MLLYHADDLQGAIEAFLTGKCGMTAVQVVGACRRRVETRSSVGSVTTVSNLLRMLYSRAGTYPAGQPELHGEAFSTNSPEGACPRCHGIGRVYDATEQAMVPDDSLTIRQRAIAAWPPAWGGQNQRDILVTLGYDVDRPWRELRRKDRDWILFTEDQPTVPVYAGFTPEETAGNVLMTRAHEQESL